MPITQAQVKEAQEKLNDVQSAASRVNEILVRANEVILADEKGKTVIDLTSSQKTQLLSEYAKAKTALNNAVAQLP